MKIYQVDAFTDIPFKGNPAGSAFLNQNLQTSGCRICMR